MKRKGEAAELSGSPERKDKTDRPATKRLRRSPETEVPNPHVAGPSFAVPRSQRVYSRRNRTGNYGVRGFPQVHERSPSPNASGTAGPSQ